jgi:hypothetical protein
MKNLIFILVLLTSFLALGATKSLQGDNWKSSNLSKTWTPSATAGSLVTAQSVSGDMTAVVSGDLTNVQLKNSGVTASSDYTSVTVNSKGLVTAAVSYKAPTTQILTAVSGTYTTPAGVKYIRIRMVGAGAGGAGGGTASSSSNSGAGGSATFGTSLLTAEGATAAVFSANAAVGLGFTINSPAFDLGDSRAGQSGGGTYYNSGAGPQARGGYGGSSPLGGGGSPAAAGACVTAQGFGSGGAGGAPGPNAGAYAGAGGASGAYINAQINNPSATYAFTNSTGGAAGAAGTGGYAGCPGSNSVIIVDEYYQ